MCILVQGNNMNECNETFKIINIKEYGDILVGSFGTIIGKRGKMKPNNKNSKGYYRVHIGNHHYAVHRLVAMAFIPNPDNLPQVNHKDGDKSHNYINNLEWCTNKENKDHATLNNLVNSKITYEDSIKIRELYATNRYTYFDLANMFNVSYSNIGYIIRNNIWNPKKYEER